jgi:hypothetical protein
MSKIHFFPLATLIFPLATLIFPLATLIFPLATLIFPLHSDIYARTCASIIYARAASFTRVPDLSCLAACVVVVMIL